MLIRCISDTHNSHNDLNEYLQDTVDVLVHTGDSTIRGGDDELIRFLDWYQDRPARYKLFISGNHDFVCQKKEAWVREEANKRNLIYLRDESITIEGVKFYGSPWQPYFGGWAWNFPEDKRRYKFAAIQIWEKIPSDTDVLLTHGPPYGVFDRVFRPRYNEDPNVGCKYLLERIQKVRPKLHVFGHIHEHHGSCIHEGTTFVNASSQNTSYSGAYREPITIEVADATSATGPSLKELE